MANSVDVMFVFAILLAASYICTGLAALWAATSRRHWLVRSAAMLVLLSPLLLVPAYELWILFALQVCVVVSGVKTWRRWTARRQGKPNRRFRFFLSTLLAITPLVAVVTAILARIAANLPPPTPGTWTTMGLNGTCSGCAVLLGVWVFVSQRKRIAWPVALVSCLSLAAIMAVFDWLFVSVTWSKHWNHVPATPLGLGTFDPPHYPALTWLTILPAVMGITWLAIRLWFAGTSSPEAADQPRPPKNRNARFVARCLLALLLLALSLPPTLMAWKLLHLMPMPTIAIPEPNGFDDIVAAGKVFSRSQILSTSIEPISSEELAAEISKHAAAYKQLRAGLGREIQSYARVQSGDLMAAHTWWFKNLPLLRSVERALMREAELARRQGRYGDSAKIALENIHLGQALASGGLLADCRVGNSIAEVGKQSLYQALPGLNAKQCREMIAALDEMERQREPIADVVLRDRIWEEHADGWFSHLCMILGNAVSPGSREPHHIHARAETLTRLLIAELAVRAYRLEQDELPDRLEQLARGLPDNLLVDPFDPHGRPLRFLRTSDRFVVYSVGADGEDDGGRPLDRDENGRPIDFGEGDQSLDVFFAPTDEGSGDSPADE